MCVCVDSDVVCICIGPDMVCACVDHVVLVMWCMHMYWSNCSGSSVRGESVSHQCLVMPISRFSFPCIECGYISTQD